MIKSFFLFQKLMESLEIINNSLMDAIGANEINSYELLNYDISKLNIETLNNDDKFITALSKLDLKSSEVENTDDYETYISDTYKFMLIHELNAPDIETPLYIISQSYDYTLNKWSDIKMYKITGNFNVFYDKLSSKTIQIYYDYNTYTYHTDNGNEWKLINGDENDIFKKYFRDKEFKILLKSNNFHIEIL